VYTGPEWCARVSSRRPRGFQMASLHVVTNGACKGLRNGCGCRACTAGLSRIVAWRVHCEACGNDPERCREGQGPVGDFERLVGCRAFTDDGKVRPKKAKAPPRQPWQPKKAA
jgi:hypothetical protein